VIFVLIGRRGIRKAVDKFVGNADRLVGKLEEIKKRVKNV